MSHIAVELKVIEVYAPMVARAVGEPIAATLGGLNLLWHRCWSTKSATITRIGLAGIFGMENLDLRCEAMVDAGFLEVVDAGFRVRGAEKYLRVREGNSKGGKAASGNLKRGVSRPGAEPGRSRGGAGEEPGVVPGSMPALTPSTEHRAPNTEHQKEEAPPPRQPVVAAFEIVPPNLEAIDNWTKEDFWKAAELTRRAAGFPPQMWPSPVELSRWWSAAQQVADTRTLADAFVRFTESKHWRGAEPPCPWRAFAKQFLDFLPSRGAA